MEWALLGLILDTIGLTLIDVFKKAKCFTSLDFNTLGHDTKGCQEEQ